MKTLTLGSSCRSESSGGNYRDEKTSDRSSSGESSISSGSHSHLNEFPLSKIDTLFSSFVMCMSVLLSSHVTVPMHLLSSLC